ncbi:Spermidine synthase [Caulifigura coniformis]|uniref:Spermidine synthase n=2 Tax=Caulifigura coniformis TaxID=2527983 RepID=A0A517SLN6_9PLAN|nr:Spermidine synthase [Caulifigura coniformis]
MSRLRYLSLCALFFLSGGAGLAYEVSWTRQLGEILGHTSRSAGVVLAAYFGGLAIGYELGGRYSSRVSPLLGYAAAEVITAIWATAIPRLLDLIGSAEVVRWLDGRGGTSAAMSQAAISFLILLPSTAGLGATLPFMSEGVKPSQSRKGFDRVAFAYGVNTFGAMLGVVISTSTLLVHVGVRSTGMVAAATSLACAVIAAQISHSWKAGESASSILPGSGARGPSGSSQSSTAQVSAGLSASVSRHVTAAISGFTILSLEVLYLRLFSLVFHNSSYSFGVVLAVFLFGLAMAATLASWFTGRFPAIDLVSLAMWSGSVAIAVSVLLFQQITQLAYLQTDGGFGSYIAACAGLAIKTMLVPATILGIILPALWSEAAYSESHRGRDIARLTMVNTLAAACGSLVTSFWLLPTLGLWNAFVTLAVLLSVAALLRTVSRRRWRVASLYLTSSATAVTVLVIASSTESKGAEGGRRLIRRWESSYGWIDALEDSRTGVRELRQNVHYRYGSTGDDLTRERRQAHLPLLLHPKPRKALFLGLGTGITAGAALLHNEVESFAVVELIPEVVEAARLLGEANLAVTDHPRATIAVDDARHFLLSTEQSFDVVVGDLFVPWESQTGYLYSREHFARVSDRLNEGGLFCQWLALYQLGASDFAIIADTFATIFPDCTLWWGHLDRNRPMVALIGIKGELEVDRTNLVNRMLALSRAERVTDDFLDTPEHLQSLLIGRWQVHGQPRLNTVEHPLIEFLTPRSQQNNSLLRRSQLRHHFDSVLAQLSPASPVQFGMLRQSDLSRTNSLAAQRFMLFGDTAPAPPK